MAHMLGEIALPDDSNIKTAYIATAKRPVKLWAVVSHKHINNPCLPDFDFTKILIHNCN